MESRLPVERPGVMCLVSTKKLLFASVAFLFALLSSGCSYSTPPQVDKVPLDLVRIDGITYKIASGPKLGRPTVEEDLGPRLATVRAKAKGIPRYRLKRDGSATFLEPGSPVYAFEGYDTSFRIAARDHGSLTPYEVSYNPEAKVGSDLLDISDKVRYISINGQADVTKELSSIRDPERVSSLVEGLMKAPVDQEDQDQFGTGYHIVFHLKDGTAVVRTYRTDTGVLEPGIEAPEAFRQAVVEALSEEKTARASSTG